MDEGTGAVAPRVDVDARKRSPHVRSERRRGRVSCARQWQLGSPPSASSGSTPCARLPAHETLTSETARGSQSLTAAGARSPTREASMCERTARTGHINTTRGRASREPRACGNCIWICRLLCPRSVFRVLFFSFSAPSSAAGLSLSLPVPSIAAAGMSSTTYSASRSWQDLPRRYVTAWRSSPSRTRLFRSACLPPCARPRAGQAQDLRAGPASVGVETRQAAFRS